MSSVTYTLRKIDILEFNEHYAKMNGAYGKSIMRHQIIWPAVISVMALYIVMTSEDTQLGLLLLSCAFAWSLLVPAWIKKRFHQYILEQLSEEDIPTETEIPLVQDKGIEPFCVDQAGHRLANVGQARNGAECDAMIQGGEDGHAVTK